MSSATWELLIPQKDFGFNFLFVAVKRHPIWVSQVAQFAIVHAYLQKIYRQIKFVAKLIARWLIQLS